MSSVLDRRLSRRRFLGASAAGGAAVLLSGTGASALAATPASLADRSRRDEDEDWFEASIPRLQRLMRQRRALERRPDQGLPAADPRVGSGARRGHRIEPAGAIDRGPTRPRASSATRPGSAAWIPVLLKDNVATNDRMETTAGSLALVGSRRPARCRDRAETAARWRRDPRQGEPVGVGQLPRLHPARIPERLECARRFHAQPVRPRAGIRADRVPVRRSPRRRTSQP